MAGTHEGTVISFPQLTTAFEAFETKPHAQKVLDADGGNLVVLQFAAGQLWREHHSVHPIIVQVLAGKVLFRVRGEELELVPGKPLHLSATLLHEVEAVEDSTVMVTMLTGETHEPAIINCPESRTF
ncbi:MULTISPECIES: cupin domain-containing protein [unclassified Rothia (in: high G+C Gram-positive bacteria)]|uniref:cupin domain-containing protein n=1 Tax=unclassified Rothia (in: high G+C Gram-positive bacteria) TaxID=2689056 RepID=UPI00195754E3|nr:MULTISPECIES: cupin domain-containing protein [unclassified Rothia (in: high G+C Gram-positive bacteria)]MBM7051918.1 cupin domain-containing protein [Rothia sp. ZJ1223]QRZ62007.1 cupin domain-containing protein [Rothia sp. ZJ932]